MTDINPSALTLLRALREAHRIATTPEAKNDLTVYLRGGKAEQIKTDIVSSALLAARNHRLAEEKRVAATGLLELLSLEK